MSYFEEQAERLRDQRDLAKHLATLIETETLKDMPELGIARQVIDQGRPSLSEKQEWVFRTKVYEVYCEQRCNNCGDRIPVAEAWDYEHAGLQDKCSSCRHDWQKLN